MRDELLELRPFTFLSEIRYRELKQRWGQVFRADMGAEAFYDILERLDLDKLDRNSGTKSRPPSPSRSARRQPRA